MLLRFFRHTQFGQKSDDMLCVLYYKIMYEIFVQKGIKKKKRNLPKNKKHPKTANHGHSIELVLLVLELLEDMP